MTRSKSSHNWLQEHVNDPYVKQAQRDGYRSRASYKLIQLHEKDKLIRPGMLVVDLGSAPGGWSQVLSRLLGEKGRVVATDILPMDPVKNVEFVQGDFTEESVLNEVLRLLGGHKPELVLDIFREGVCSQAGGFEASFA
jgi:23S rRNA (uridine2552-2'-O)-methyltransferase